MWMDAGILVLWGVVGVLAFVGLILFVMFVVRIAMGESNKENNKRRYIAAPPSPSLEGPPAWHSAS
jgi:hypothetical protein